MQTSQEPQAKLTEIQHEIRSLQARAAELSVDTERQVARLDECGEQDKVGRFASCVLQGAVDDLGSIQQLLELAANVDEAALELAEEQTERDGPPSSEQVKGRVLGCVASAYSIVQELEQIERELLLTTAAPIPGRGNYALLRAAHMSLYETVGLLVRAASEDPDEQRKMRRLLRITDELRSSSDREASDEGEFTPEQFETALGRLQRRARDLHASTQAVEQSLEDDRGDAALPHRPQRLALVIAEKCLRLASEQLSQTTAKAVPGNGSDPLQHHHHTLWMLMRKAFALTIAARQLQASMIPVKVKAPEIDSSVGSLATSVVILGRVVELLAGQQSLTPERMNNLWSEAHADADTWYSRAAARSADDDNCDESTPT